MFYSEKKYVGKNGGYGNFCQECPLNANLLLDLF